MLSKLRAFGALTLVSLATAVTVPTERVALGWYASWTNSLSQVPWKQYTHVAYSFAETTPNPTSFLGDDDPRFENQIAAFVAEAHKNDVKALLSIGGWSGSIYFSSNVGSAENRTALVKTVTNLVTKLHLDGVDFDWEFPGTTGQSCNIINPDDTSNLLKFLQELRAHPTGAKILLTAAVLTTPFAGPDSKPLEDVSAFAKVLDFISIMNYDRSTPRLNSVAGANAPLRDGCSPEQKGGSATSAVREWTKAGIPREQLVLGVPTYGHSFRVRKADAYARGTLQTLATFPPHDQSDIPADPHDTGYTDECGQFVPPEDGLTFTQMRDKGFIDSSGDPRFSEGIVYHFDNCTETVFAYNPKTEVYVSYDDGKGFHSKGKFVREEGLRGFAVWEVSGDFDNILLNYIRLGAGYPIAP